MYRLAADSISSCCFRHRVFLCIRNVPLTILRFRVTLSLQSLSLLWLLVPDSPNITISVQALLLFSVTYVLYLNKLQKRIKLSFFLITTAQCYLLDTITIKEGTVWLLLFTP